MSRMEGEDPYDGIEDSSTNPDKQWAFMAARRKEAEDWAAALMPFTAALIRWAKAEGLEGPWLDVNLHARPHRPEALRLAMHTIQEEMQRQARYGMQGDPWEGPACASCDKETTEFVYACNACQHVLCEDCAHRFPWKAPGLISYLCERCFQERSKEK